MVQLPKFHPQMLIMNFEVSAVSFENCMRRSLLRGYRVGSCMRSSHSDLFIVSLKEFDSTDDI